MIDNSSPMPLAQVSKEIQGAIDGDEKYQWHSNRPHDWVTAIEAAQVELEKLRTEVVRLNEWADGFSDRQLTERRLAEERIREIERERDNLRAYAGHERALGIEAAGQESARLATENRELLSALDSALDAAFWLTRSSDFSPGGQAYEGWRTVRPKLYAAAAVAKRCERDHPMVIAVNSPSDASAAIDLIKSLPGKGDK